jgi:peptidoglycan hydrolase CwlO-like protein
MMSLSKIIKYAVLASFVVSLNIMTVGCTKRPSQEELTKLEEAKTAAESAERKLAELKKERMDLESQVQAKEDELKTHQQERDDLKQKMGK